MTRSSGSFGSFGDFAATARSEKPMRHVIPLVPETNAPAQQISRLFQFQSYFDDLELERAILVQNPNEPIVESTVKEEQVPGYAIGLHPTSQTPVAVQFKVGGQLTSAMPIILKPGQIVRPHGLPPGMNTGAFSGFRWGLPFGWLGGGLATLLVFQTPDSDVAWPGNHEVIFHRQRMQITSVAGAPANARFNWPLRFPWVQAFRSVANLVQQGLPALAVEPTKVRMSLRLNSLDDPSTMRIIFQGSNDFDLDAAGADILTPTRFRDFIWGSYAASGIAGNLGTSFPVEFMPDELVRLSTCDGTEAPPLNAINDGGVALVDLLGGDLTDQFVDVVRYGRIG